MTTTGFEGGTIIYKCRLCGGLNDGLHAPGVLTALVCVLTGTPLPGEWAGASMLTERTLHHCPDGATGIADIVGGRKDE